MAAGQRVDAPRWLAAVIRYLRAAGDAMPADEVFARTRIARTDFTESLLHEHPSLTLRAGRVLFAPFAAVTNQRELLQLMRRRFPRALRRVDLAGLYAWVEEDIDQLIFDGNVTVLCPATQSMVAPTLAAVEDESLRDAWAALSK